jgi:hypothetical protein
MTEELSYDALGLPPKGHEQREELKRREDNLQQQIEEQTPDAGAIPHDHDALNPERNREIQHAMSKDYLTIGANHPYLKTKWVNYVNLNGQKVWEAKADGWMVATQHEFPEAKELTREDNTIRIGDVLLMCIRMDEYFRIEQREKDKRLRQQFGVEAEIHDFAKRNPRAFAGAVTPELGESGHISQTTRSAIDSAESRADARSAARKTAAQHLGNRMKQGTIPGVPLPEKE